MRKITTAHIFPLLCGFVMLGAVLALATPAHAAYQVGDTINDFTLKDLNGNPVSLSDFAGDIIVINFFATWCAGCNVEAAILENNIHQVYREHGVTVIGRDRVLRYAKILFNEEAITTTLNYLLGFDPVADEAQSFGQLKALCR
ncbi:MAG: TlpA disulfide reductase family protein [Candidatus Krumholzibacteria bacterium]|nr:TlpA disulfide reductase family protein [Candidatus Krumholzibacteria bacterium]